MMDKGSLPEVVAALFERPGNVRNALPAGAALYEAGHTELAVAIWTMCDDVNPALRRIKDNAQMPAELRRLSALADQALCEFLVGLHQHAVDTFEAQHGVAVPRVRSSIWPLTHPTKVHFREPLQQPLIFYMPDLRATPIEPNAAFSWVAALEAAVPAIRREFESAVRDGIVGMPYVPAGAREPEWQRLSGSLDWSAIHLYQQAQETSAATHFPDTVRALDTVKLVKIGGTPMEVFFSRLKAGAHIPPHFGLTNTRVTVHLPLVVPAHCAIRVATHVHEWREGEVFAFDDSFEHEAWNRSDTDRVVLIFEAHHPDLSAHERDAIEHAYGVRQNWLDARQALIRDWLSAGR